MILWRTAASKTKVMLNDVWTHCQTHNRVWARDHELRRGVVFDFFDYGGSESSRNNWFLVEMSYDDIIAALTELARVDERARLLLEMEPKAIDITALHEELGLNCKTKVVHE